MKKGSLHFLGRKNQSLFDTNVKMKDMDNVELVLGSSAILESGTASVRARPTVKHHASSFDSFQGFAVPTPKVPLLPPANGPKLNGSVAGGQLYNGSVISLPDLAEGELVVPPPPSMAPPPLPLSFIPPPLDFMGDLKSLDLAALQPPSMPAPKPAFPPLLMEEEDLSLLKPPPMAPPKPPSTCSSGSASSIPISSPSPVKVPERPKFAPPLPPSERQHKTHKTPPPKPIRLSSVSNFDPPPHTPAPPPPVHTSTLSTFNPQNTAKLYTVPKTKLLCVNEDHDARPKQMLLLEDSGSVNSLPVLVKVDGKAPKVDTPPKPAPKDAPELKENLKMIQPSKSPLPELRKEAKTEEVSPQSEKNKPPHSQQPQKVTNTVSPQSEKTKPPQSQQIQKATSTVSPQSEISKPPQSQQPQKVTNTVSPESEKTTPQSQQIQKATSTVSPQSEISQPPQSQQPHKVTNVQVDSERSKKLEVSPRQSHNFSPILDRKLRNLRANEIHGARDGHAASPLALLMAAKEREKHRPTHSLSREGSTKKSEEPRASIPPSDSSPNSLNVISRSGSSSLTPTVHKLHESTPSVRQVEHAQTIQSPEKSSCPDQIQSSNPALSRVKADSSLTVNNLAEKRQSADQSPSFSQAVQHNDQKGELNIPLLPPPPEFEDFNEITEPPPSICPPDPPLKKVPTPLVFQSPAPASAPAPLPNHTPPPPPKLPPSDIDIKPKPQVQTKPKPAPAQLPPALSPSQATLLGILQKKMLEMDDKMDPAREAESTSDEWATTLSDDDNKIPVAPKAKAQAKNSPVVNKSATLDMRELESKVARKFHESSQVKAPTSNAPHSKYQHGKTFTIRPGTKQPITLVTKEDS